LAVPAHSSNRTGSRLQSGREPLFSLPYEWRYRGNTQGGSSELSFSQASELVRDGASNPRR
jgi:hypothetical protein